MMKKNKINSAEHEVRELQGAKDYFFIAAICVAMVIVGGLMLGYLTPADLYSATSWAANLVNTTLIKD